MPAVSTNGQATAYFYLNSTRDTLCIRAAWSNLSGAPTGIHIHEGEMGTNGSVVFNLTTDIVGNKLVSRITGSAITSSVIAKLLSGQYYLNIHTSANPNGEIRGQIMAERDPGFYAVLNTAQETGTVNGSTATGLAVIKVARDKKSFWIEQVNDDLTETPGGAHIHYAPSGQDGPVFVDLTSLINGNRISGTVMCTPGIIDSIMSGNAYINVHTTMNASGEIRGQIANLPDLGFDAVLDTAQETGPVLLSDGNGVAHFHLSNTLDTLHFYVQVSGLTGSISGAHLHEAAAGSDGSVVLDLSSYVSGNIITGIVTGSTLTDDLVNDMFTGGLYLNVHTNANMNGEIRGQVYRYLREGYVFELDGAQESTPVNTNATGVGFASVDRDQSNIYYSVTVNGLSGALNGAHFHEAARGTDGSVVYNITDDFMKMGSSDYAMGYLMIPDAAQKAAIRNNMLYLNVHTSANMNGEIRGQVERSSPCADAPLNTSVMDVPVRPEFSVYPNPSNGIVNVNFKEKRHGKVNLINLQGQILNSYEITGEITQLDLRGMPKGIYLLQLVGSSESVRVSVQ